MLAVLMANPPGARASHARMRLPIYGEYGEALLLHPRRNHAIKRGELFRVEGARWCADEPPARAPSALDPARADPCDNEALTRPRDIMRRRGAPDRLNHATAPDMPPLPPIRFACSPERWWGDEALKAEAQAAQAPGEERHQAACNILAMRPRSLFSAGVRFATASHMPVDTAQ